MQNIRSRIRGAAPELGSSIDTIVGKWLAVLLERLKSTKAGFRPKQVNDPVWGTIELLPWEVALLDTPLLQRLRGVKQLGLAHLVFPGACHGRLEHTIGVVGVVENSLRTLQRQIDRWNRENPQKTLPEIEDRDRYAMRLAGLLHDMGHGPFSHAIEPVFEVEAPLVTSANADRASDWRRQIEAVRNELGQIYELNGTPSRSEAIAVMIVLSEAMTTALESDRLFTHKSRPADELQEILVAAIIGAAQGPGTSFLSAVVSSQIDADKLDYLARDAHHAGLEIGFDTDRLLSRMEVLLVREDNLDASLRPLRERAAKSEGGAFHQLGIAASGFGSFEQMLIGRTFLYDRLYHHHKVRAAEAMAQRLMLVAERDRNERLKLEEIFLPVDDETMLRIFAGEVTHPAIKMPSAPSKANSLARGILDRDLLHRAFAFRGRFIASPQGLDNESASANQQTLWRRIVKELDTLHGRYALGEKIFDLACRCAEALANSENTKERGVEWSHHLRSIGPEQIIVDLPLLKAEAIRILARYPDGSLKVPEFSFNPVKWSDAYELQKRTGYVFCPREVVAPISLASKIVFLAEFGASMAKEADGYIKAVASADKAMLSVLTAANIIDECAADHLQDKRRSLIAMRADDLATPKAWLQEDDEFPVRLKAELNRSLIVGLSAEHHAAFSKVLEATWIFVDEWFDSDKVTKELANEAELQERLRQCFKYQRLAVTEGSRTSGGFLDLFVENAITVENKFHDTATKRPETVAKSAGMQGRRYSIALDSQIVIVFSAYRCSPGSLPSKPSCVSAKKIAEHDKNRVEIRISLPFGAPTPSHEKAEAPKTQ